jgi:hypothetical protein
MNKRPGDGGNPYTRLLDEPAVIDWMEHMAVPNSTPTPCVWNFGCRCGTIRERLAELRL